LEEINSVEKIEINGIVVDERMRPVAGAKVICNGEETLTLFDGTFNFKNSGIGIHIIKIELEGYVKQSKDIKVEEGEEPILEFQLKPMEGSAKIFGYILDEETQKPIEIGGLVYMFRPISNKNAPINPKDGFYEFTNLPAGIYNIWTSILGYEEQGMTVTIEDYEKRQLDFILSKKEEEEVPWG
jgi:hypothetical protein